jgi:glutathione S-transferase
MHDLTLFHAVLSRSITVHWMLEETGQPYDIELMSLEAEDHKRPEYLRWLFFAPVTAEPSVIWQSMNLPDDLEYKPFAEVEDVARVLADALRGREFIVGGHMSAADVMIGSTVFWRTRLMPVLPPLPELTEYWERLEQRPAWQRSFGVDQKLMARKAEGP